MLGMGIQEAAAACGVGRSTIYEAIKAGDLRARKCGRRTIILQEDLEMYLRSLPIFNEATKAEPAANKARQSGCQ